MSSCSTRSTPWFWGICEIALQFAKLKEHQVLKPGPPNYKIMSCSTRQTLWSSQLAIEARLLSFPFFIGNNILAGSTMGTPIPYNYKGTLLKPQWVKLSGKKTRKGKRVSQNLHITNRNTKIHLLFLSHVSYFSFPFIFM